MNILNRLAQYRQLTELASIATTYHVFSFIGNLIDSQEGIIEHRVSQLASQHLLRHLKLEVKVVGLEHLRGLERYCVASNHTSYLDWAVLLGYFPSPLRFIAKTELAKVPVIGSYLKLRGILIDRKSGTTAMQAIRTAVKDNLPWPILIFPEGTRTPDGQIQHFKTGGLRIIAEAGMPIVPVCLIGTYEALPRHKSMVNIGGKIHLVISPPIIPRNFENIENAVAAVEQSAREAFASYH